MGAPSPRRAWGETVTVSVSGLINANMPGVQQPPLFVVDPNQRLFDPIVGNNRERRHRVRVARG